MILISNPDKSQWQEILKRPVMNTENLFDTVRSVIDRVKEEGDRAVLDYEEKFDKVMLASLAVSEEEQQEAENLVSEDLKAAIRLAKQNIETFHAAQRFEGKKVQTQPGVTCWQKAVAIEKVGLYIPGGTAPLFSTVLMLAVPARLAGCHEIVMCTPPGKEGKIAPAILYAARETGIDRIFKLGGVQAIGAMAFGTESVPQVYKIFGPGNRYVMAAKQQVSVQGVAIDMPAGPSEVMIVADSGADVRFLAADFLSQAEHGADSQSILLTTDRRIADLFPAEIERQLDRLPRREWVEKSLSHSSVVLLEREVDLADFVNAYAPEHLIVHRADAEEWASAIVNAGSVFLGYYFPESAGDYASGTNHTLPTGGYAKSYSGVNLDSFTRKITFQQISSEGLKNLGPVIEEMAEAERLEAHKEAVTVRLQSIHS